MFSRLSIHVKFLMVFTLAVALVVVALLVGVKGLKERQLRNEAVTVAEQVVSFRSWVANTGVVWVNQLTGDFHDFLGKRPDAAGNFFFSKNPALATRELSSIVSKSSTRATFRVTSDEYRNPQNKPDAFEAEAIQLFKQGKEIKFSDTFSEGNYRYAQPIYVKKACLRCHGDPAKAPKDVIDKYGDQRAFGYKIGDVRGIISVKLPDIGLGAVMQSFLNPFTIGLIVLAFLITFVFTQYAIIARLKKLAETTEKISKGDVKAALTVVPNSHDEIVQVSRAVDMLRNSLVVAMRHMKKR